MAPHPVLPSVFRVPSRALLGMLLAVGAAGCGGVDPGSLKAVNLGFPPGGRGLGSLAVTPDGHPNVNLYTGGLWVLQGSLEEDTHVWVQRVDVGQVSELLGYAEGVGVVGTGWKDGSYQHLFITEEGATYLPKLADGTLVRPLMRVADGAILGVAKRDIALHRLAPGSSTWEPIAGTEPGAPDAERTASAVLHPNGKIYALNGSRVFELAADLTSPSKLFDCNTRELGSCGVNSRVFGGLRMDRTGRMTLGVSNDEPELYAFRPGDSKLTKRAYIRPPVNEQSYFGRPYDVVVDRQDNAYVAIRTEQVGGEGHVLAHRGGAGPDAWVTSVKGLPRVLNLEMDGKDSVWVWDHSDDYSGLWKLVPSSLQCPRCVAP